MGVESHEYCLELFGIKLRYTVHVSINNYAVNMCRGVVMQHMCEAPLYRAHQLHMSAEVDRVLDCCRAITISLYPSLAWLIKIARPVMIEWAMDIINESCLEGRVLMPSRRHSLGPSIRNQAF